MIIVNNISKRFKNVNVLNNISFSFKMGKTYSIIGPSGSGKSTFLKCIASLETLESGSIQYININKKNIGFVFQNFNLFTNMTILENIIYAPQQILGEKKQIVIDKARQLLKKVNLDASIENKYPNNISSGQKQRAAIARTLCMQPQVLLYDEPTSALDIENTAEVLNVINNLSKSKKLLNIIVTHHIKFAANISESILFFDKGQIIEQNDSKNFFNNPQTSRLKDFLSKLKILNDT